MPALQPQREVTPRQQEKIRRSSVLEDRTNRMQGPTRHKHKVDGKFEVISRPCATETCKGIQVRLDRQTWKPEPFQWVCGTCGRIDEEPSTPTRRELDIVKLICDGKSTKEIAVALGISVKTAETHRSNLFRRLDIHCVALIVRWAMKHNIIDRWHPPTNEGA